MAYIREMECCSVREICDLSNDDNAELSMKLITNDFTWVPSCAYLIFTDAGTVDYGKNFMAYIIKRDLGEVMVVGPSTNPNTGRKVNVYTWKINIPVFTAFVREKGKKAATGKKLL